MSDEQIDDAPAVNTIGPTEMFPLAGTLRPAVACRLHPRSHKLVQTPVPSFLSSYQLSLGNERNQPARIFYQNLVHDLFVDTGESQLWGKLRQRDRNPGARIGFEFCLFPEVRAQTDMVLVASVEQ